MFDREKQGTISAMFWGCITYNGVGTIIPINVTCNMNSVKYIETLDMLIFDDKMNIYGPYSPF
jgi:hypothetical protein